MDRFYLVDVPEHQTVFQFIKEQSDWYTTRDNSKPSREYPTMLEFALPSIDMDRLAASVSDNFNTFGEYGWVTKDRINDHYTGVSLMYNPNHQDGLDIHQSSLGTPKNGSGKFGWGIMDTHEVLKNSYFDTYSFTQPTPFTLTGYFGELAASMKLNMIRSRISTIHGKYVDPNKLHKRWHKDESIFENIRLNIPVTTSPEFLFELEDNPPIHLEVGTAYSWDTNKWHGVYGTETSDNSRTNIVFGFSPWFRFDQEGQYWEKNEWYGKHPFDMYYDGNICPLLQPKF